MGDKGQEGGESQVEIWKIKRVCESYAHVLAAQVPKSGSRVKILPAAAYKSLGGGQRQWHIHD